MLCLLPMALKRMDMKIIRANRRRGKKNRSLVLVILGSSLLLSCDFLSVEMPANKVTKSQVFSSDKSANSAAIEMYLDLYGGGSFAAGLSDGVVSLAGLSADELMVGLQSNVVANQFQNNQLLADNTYILNAWTSMYHGVFQSNSILEGIAASSAITKDKRDQLRGEALFIRGFCYFYLVNFFGEVPLILTTDYQANAAFRRNTVEQIYDQIKNDLTEAESLLKDNYIEVQRIRPNKYAAQALLARVYLFTNDFARAEDKASSVLNSTQYVLVDPKNVFLANSKETIWQIKPPDGATYTNEGLTFGSNQGPKNNVLRKSLMKMFEPNDQRKIDWTTSVIISQDTIFLPFKYKKQDFETPTTEYSMVLRLSEQYLIRAEARARQGKIAAAISDIDQVRFRANIALLKDRESDITQNDLIAAILAERKVELFVEWGHRWLDLKRSGLASTALSPIKSGWSDNDLLYPIPEKELLNNPNLRPQNNGY